LPVSLRRSSLKLTTIFFLAFATIFAQGLTNYLTPGVARVGAKLACRCSGCKNTVGDCPMLRCDYSDPLRHRIYEMQAKGMSDSAIVQTVVREQGVAALSGQPPLGILVWLMPGIALAIGFLIYSRWVRRNRKQPEALTPVDQAIIDRFQAQIDRELDESPSPAKEGGERK
jgi:cytochrome c-type biogenesis protein CcmH/NrfF